MESEWIRLISTAILGWIAYEMRGLRKDVAHRVPYADCNRRMDEHRQKLNELDDRIRIHGHKIAAIEECQSQNHDAKLIQRKRRNNDGEPEDFY